MNPSIHDIAWRVGAQCFPYELLRVKSGAGAIMTRPATCSGTANTNRTAIRAPIDIATWICELSASVVTMSKMYILKPLIVPSTNVLLESKWPEWSTLGKGDEMFVPMHLKPSRLCPE